MPKINRSKLQKIVQEELKSTIIEEGLFDTLAVVGKDIQKYIKDVSFRGEEHASRKDVDATIRGLQATIQSLENRMQKTGGRSPEIKQKLDAAKTALTLLQKKPGSPASEEVVQAIGQGAGADVDRPDIQQGLSGLEWAKKVLGKEVGDEKGAEGAAAAPEETPRALKSAIITDPVAVLKLVIRYLGQSKFKNQTNAVLAKMIADTGGDLQTSKKGPKGKVMTSTYPLKSAGSNLMRKVRQWDREAKKGEPGAGEEQEKAVAEGLAPGTKVSRSVLRETVELIQNAIQSSK